MNSKGNGKMMKKSMEYTNFMMVVLLMGDSKTMK
jgi:hypothetical protein